MLATGELIWPQIGAKTLQHHEVCKTSRKSHTKYGTTQCKFLPLGDKIYHFFEMIQSSYRALLCTFVLQRRAKFGLLAAFGGVFGPKGPNFGRFLAPNFGAKIIQSFQLCFWHSQKSLIFEISALRAENFLRQRSLTRILASIFAFSKNFAFSKIFRKFGHFFPFYPLKRVAEHTKKPTTITNGTCHTKWQRISWKKSRYQVLKNWRL